MVMYERRSACGVTRLSMPIRREPSHDGGGVVALHAVAPPIEQQRSVGAAGQRLVDRLVRARVQRHLGGLVALADDPQRRLVPRATEIAHVGAAGFGHA